MSKMPVTSEIEKFNAAVANKSLPMPLATHEDVVNDSTLFANTLRNYHFALGSRISIPVIGGRELNLHVLYKEVTRRGGYDKVVSEKKWREVGSVFEFSPTTTSASFVLRKHYHTLLFGYELMYFFRLHDSKHNQTAGQSSFDSFHTVGIIDAKFDCGYLVTVKVGDQTLNGVLYHTGHPLAPLPPPAPVPQPVNAIVPYNPQVAPPPPPASVPQHVNTIVPNLQVAPPPPPASVPQHVNTTVPNPQVAPAPPPVSVPQHVSTIAPNNPQVAPPAPPAPVPQPVSTNVPNNPQVAPPAPPAPVPQPVSTNVPNNPQLQRQGRGRKRRSADPGRPKANRSGYNFYFQEKHAALKSLYPSREREFTKMIGHAWTNLSEEEKSVYQKIGVQDKERYQRELEEYKQKRTVEAPAQQLNSNA